MRRAKMTGVVAGTIAFPLLVLLWPRWRGEKIQAPPMNPYQTTGK
jgi:hypothetical protein